MPMAKSVSTAIEIPKLRSASSRICSSGAGLRSSATMNHASAAPATMKQPITSGALHPPGFDGELPRASA